MALIILSGLLAFLFLTSFALIITEPFPPLFSTLSFSLCSLLLLTVSVTLFLTIFSSFEFTYLSVSPALEVPYVNTRVFTNSNTSSELGPFLTPTLAVTNSLKTSQFGDGRV